MAFLDNIGSAISNDLDQVTPGLTGEAPHDGFIVAANPSANGNGLPSSKVVSQRLALARRSLIHWFVPEFGVVKMYVNPEGITYSNQKLINPERTKGGYTLQYWGEQLGRLTLRGTTGSSGIEGINVLEEIYRAEQLAFDAIGLTLAADPLAQDLTSSLVSGAGNAIGGLFGDKDGLGGSIASSLFGTDIANQSLATRNIPSLAQFAFSVEMYYQGCVYRGYFNSFTVEEQTSALGLFSYTIEFMVTEKRGYRLNYMPWHKSANSGPSGDAIPYSFSKLK